MAAFSDFLKDITGLDFASHQNEYFFIKGMTPNQETDLQKQLKKAGIHFQHEQTVVFKSMNKSVFAAWKKTRANAETTKQPLTEQKKESKPQEKSPAQQAKSDKERFLGELASDLESNAVDFIRAAPPATDAFLLIPQNKNYIYKLNMYADNEGYYFAKYDHNLKSDILPIARMDKESFGAQSKHMHALRDKSPQDKNMMYPHMREYELMREIFNAKKSGAVDLPKILQKINTDWKRDMQHIEEIENLYQNMPSSELMGKINSDLKAKKSLVFVYAQPRLSIDITDDIYSYSLYVGKNGDYVIEVSYEKDGQKGVKYSLSKWNPKNKTESEEFDSFFKEILNKVNRFPLEYEFNDGHTRRIGSPSAQDTFAAGQDIVANADNFKHKTKKLFAGLDKFLTENGL